MPTSYHDIEQVLEDARALLFVLKEATSGLEETLDAALQAVQGVSNEERKP